MMQSKIKKFDKCLIKKKIISVYHWNKFSLIKLRCETIRVDLGFYSWESDWRRFDFFLNWFNFDLNRFRFLSIWILYVSRDFFCKRTSYSLSDNHQCTKMNTHFIQFITCFFFKKISFIYLLNRTLIVVLMLIFSLSFKLSYHSFFFFVLNRTNLFALLFFTYAIETFFVVINVELYWTDFFS